MIIFKEKKINDEALFKTAKQKLFCCIKKIYSDNKELFSDIFLNYDIGEVCCEMANISYYKNFQINDLHYFDETTEFNIKVVLFVYGLDSDGDKEQLGLYSLILDDNLNILDDILTTD